eukprot:TRINITY_DN1663_c0_g1_i4.p1 TRINITY_DN1663_c0_g1~~TRINITY_DN1663_c0_g1_i4.p1  ORF type:complete len:1002 (+),score=347.34 TRINITY_DN1663_c0_g1_i4:638-3643(+)
MENLATTFRAYKDFFARGNRFFQNLDGVMTEMEDDIVQKRKELERMRKTSKEPYIFGADLISLTQRENREVPLLVNRCIEWIETNGIETEGLYRISGFKAQLEEIRASIEGGDPINFDSYNTKDVHVVTGILKNYLRSMSEPMIPFSAYNSFVDQLLVTDMPTRVTNMKSNLRNLPPANRKLLGTLLQHVIAVSKHQATNRMGIKNLSMVLSPTMLYPKEPNVLTMVEDMEKATNIVAYLAQEFQEFKDVFFESIPAGVSTPAVPAAETPVNSPPATPREETPVGPTSPQAPVLVSPNTPRRAPPLPPKAEARINPPSTPVLDVPKAPKEVEIPKGNFGTLTIPPFTGDKSPRSSVQPDESGPTLKYNRPPPRDKPQKHMTYTSSSRRQKMIDLTPPAAVPMDDTHTGGPTRPSPPAPLAPVPETPEVIMISPRRHTEFSANTRDIKVTKSAEKLEVPAKTVTSPPREIGKAHSAGKLNDPQSQSLNEKPKENPPSSFSLKIPEPARSPSVSPPASPKDLASPRLMSPPIRIVPPVQQEDDQPSTPPEEEPKFSPVQMVPSTKFGHSHSAPTSPVIPPPSIHVKKGVSFRVSRDSPPLSPRDNRVPEGETPPINILQTVEALHNFVLGGFDPDSEEIAENLKNVVYAVRDMNAILKNHPDSPLQVNFKEVQERTMKLVTNTKTWAHAKDAHSKNELKISSSHVVLAISKMTNAWEELKTVEDLETIVKATQQAANVTSQLLRALYSGAHENLDSISAQFAQKCDLLTELVNEKLLFLATDKRKRAKDSIDKFDRTNKQLESHVTRIRKMGDEEVDNLKVQIGGVTKELVATLRDITSAFESDNSSATRGNPDENSLIAEVSKKFQDETVKLEKQTVGHHEIVLKMSALSRQLVQLTRETNKDERISCLTRIIILIGEMDHLIQVDVEDRILKGSEDLSVISPYVSAVQKFASHLMLNTTSLSSDVEIRPKFRGKFLLGESLSEVMTILTMLLHIYLVSDST